MQTIIPIWPKLSSPEIIFYFWFSLKDFLCCDTFDYRAISKQIFLSLSSTFLLNTARWCFAGRLSNSHKLPIKKPFRLSWQTVLRVCHAARRALRGRQSTRGKPRENPLKRLYAVYFGIVDWEAKKKDERGYLNTLFSSEFCFKIGTCKVSSFKVVLEYACQKS